MTHYLTRGLLNLLIRAFSITNSKHKTTLTQSVTFLIEVL